MLRKIKSFLFQNTSARQTVAKNTVWLTISNFGGRLLKATVIIYGARVLGTADWGVLSYALTLASFFTIFVDPGINAIMMRDGAKGTSEERLTIFSTIFVIKLTLLGIAAALILFVAPLVTTLPGANALLPIAACIIVFDSIREFISAFIRTRERMEIETVIFLTANVAIIIFGFFVLRLFPSAWSLGWAYAAGTAVGALAAVIAIRHNLRSFFSRFSRKLVRPILKAAWPFAIVSILGILLTNTDILIISWLGTASDVGIYAAAVRIVQVLYLMPIIVQYAALPALSRLATYDKVAFRNALEQTIGMLFLISVPMAIGGAILNTEIIRLVFGEAYLPGALSFRLLMLTMIVDFPAAILSSAIFVYNRQKSLIIASALGGGGNVVLDLLLIPYFGIAGSAAATLLAQFASNWYLWHTMKRVNYFEILPRLTKIFSAAILMALLTFGLNFVGTPVLVNIAVAALFYFGLLGLVFREPLLREIKNIVLPRTAPVQP